MRLVRYNPTRSLFNFGNRMTPMRMEDFFPVWGETPANGRTGSLSPRVDIYEEEGELVMKAELPGVDKNDIAIDVKNNVLTLKGERSTEETDKKENWYRRERVYGSFTRSFELPDDVDPEKISADYKDGVLKIRFPKTEKAEPKRITVH
jgi:HSP20 family protein